MIIISRTPVRLSFFGGGTDYPDYFDFNEGAVLGTAIDKYTYISINTLSKFFDYKIRIGYSKTELVTHFNEIQHPSIRDKSCGCAGGVCVHGRTESSIRRCLCENLIKS